MTIPFLREGIGESVFMYAIGGAARTKTESIGKLAIGVKEDTLGNTPINDIGYIMFHYWNNEKAIPYRIIRKPRLVVKQDIPDGYLLRIGKDVDKFLLLEYDSTKPADIGGFDIMKVQRKGKGRYLPFIEYLIKIAI